MTSTGPRVLKGHGTENDFVVLPDPDGTVWAGDRLDPATVRRLCERRAGLGPCGLPSPYRSVLRSAVEVPQKVSERSRAPAVTEASTRPWSDSSRCPSPTYACQSTLTVSATLSRSQGSSALNSSTETQASPYRSVSRRVVPRARRLLA